MSEQDKTLQQTLTEAIGKQNANKDSQSNETEEGISASENNGETQSGGTPEYVSGVDISDIPEQDRPRIRELLSKKSKLLEDGYQGKFKEVAQFKRTQDELIQAGLSVEEARDVLSRYIEQKKNPSLDTSKKSEAMLTLDKLIEQSPYEQKASLEQFRKIILEETNSKKLNERIESLERMVKSLSGFTQDTMRSRVEQHLDAISSKYGKTIIDKYRENFIAAHLNYNIPLEKLLTAIVPLDELEQAILLGGKKPLTNDKKNAISSAGGGVSSATEKIDIHKTSMGDILLQSLKLKK